MEGQGGAGQQPKKRFPAATPKPPAAAGAPTTTTTGPAKPAARRLGNFPLPNVAPSVPGRLTSIRPNPNLTLGGHQRKTFSPNVAQAGKKKDKPAPSARVPSILEHVTVSEDPKERLVRKKVPPRKPPPTFNPTPQAATPIISPFMQGPPEQRAKGVTVVGGPALRKGRVTTMEDIDPLNKYRPTALPFVNPVEKYEKEQKKLKKDEGGVPAPVKMEIDEGKGKEKVRDVDEEDEEMNDVEEPPKETKKRTAGDFFIKEEMMDDNLFFIQLPSTLPTHLEAQAPTEEKKENNFHLSGLEEAPFESRIGTIPDGYMGKLVIYKSGKVKLRLGDALFDVIPGTEIAFRQEAAVVAPEQKKCVVLGELSRRLRVCPDVQDLLQKADASLS